MQGLRWGIGDGRQTRLLTDRWIPGVNPEFVKPLVTVHVESTVDFIIDEDSGIRDVDRINTLF
jgi:hypothetical protein